MSLTADAINYFNHDNDYWSSKYTDERFACKGVEFFTDLWWADTKTGYEGPAKGMVSHCPATAYEPSNNLTTPYIFGVGCQAGPRGDKDYGGYLTTPANTPLTPGNVLFDWHFTYVFKYECIYMSKVNYYSGVGMRMQC